MKRIKLFSPTVSKITVNSFQGMKDGVSAESTNGVNAEYFYNFDLSDGTLRPEDVFNEISDITGTYTAPISLYFYKRVDENGDADDRIMFLGSNGYIFEFSPQDKAVQKIDDLYFTSIPVGVCYNYNGEDVIIFSSISSGLKIYNGQEVVSVPDAPSVSSMCIHFERLFITTVGENNSLWFSDDFDPTNWSVSLTEAGFIDMSDYRGKMLKVVSFADYLYVFRRYGITRVSAYGDQAEFSVNNLFVSTGMIYEKSITVCEDCILFATTDGMYRFNGISAVKISDAFWQSTDKQNATFEGQFYDGNAYFLTNMKFGASYSPCILKINPKTLKFSIIKKVEFSHLLLVNGGNEYGLYATEAQTKKFYKLENGKVSSNASEMVWQSRATDFGITAKRKLLRKMSFYTPTNATITVKSERAEKEFFVLGKTELSEIKPDVLGDVFQIQIKCQGGNARVGKIILELEYIK